MGTTWVSHAHHMGITCTPHGYHMYTTWVTLWPIKNDYSQGSLRQDTSIAQDWMIVKVWHRPGITISTPHGHHMHTTWVSHAHHMGVTWTRTLWPIKNDYSQGSLRWDTSITQDWMIIAKVWHRPGITISTPHGHHMHTTWVSHAYHMGITCTPHGYHMYTTWVSHEHEHFVTNKEWLQSGKSKTGYFYHTRLDDYIEGMTYWATPFEIHTFV